MPTARPFAYNTGAGITGTTQVGNLAIGTPEVGFVATGLEWWNGPDEDLGYVIACEVPSDTQPTPIFGVEASVGFYRSNDLTEGSFISLANKIAGPSGGGPFASGSAANTWLNNNGFWSSFEGGTGSTGATGSLLITITQNGPNVVLQGSGSLNINDLTFATSGNLGGGGLGPQTATFISGPNGVFDQYSGSISSPGTFGTGSGGASSSSTGDIFGIIYPGGPPHALVVPSGYTTGTSLSGSMTFNSQTIAGLGLTEGTYNWTWGSGPNADGITMIIGGTGPTGSTGGTGGTGGTGDFNVSITQVGPDVVWSGSGSFNLSSLTLSGTQAIGSGYNASSAIWAIGPNITTARQYIGTFTFPTSFGLGGPIPPNSVSSGSTFGLVGGGLSRTLLVPDGYTSGSVISGTVTYPNTTIATMGLNSGTYVWSWGSGGSASTMVMTIS
jgi:hypothetical protein